MISVVNLQRKIKIDLKPFREFIGALPTVISEAADSTVSVAFVSDRRMTELNKFFRGRDSTTDVLSFPHEPDEFESKSYAFTRENDADVEQRGIAPAGATLTFLGDIVISVEQAERQAMENKLTLENEIKQLILHGLLHLCGYDHETDDGEMNKRELELRDQLEI